MRTNKTKYQNETSYTLQGGKDYRETIFYLDEPIKSNKNLLQIQDTLVIQELKTKSIM